MKKLKVIDFFCGAGGFSEGFRQMGFEIVDQTKLKVFKYKERVPVMQFFAL